MLCKSKTGSLMSSLISWSALWLMLLPYYLSAEWLSFMMSDIISISLIWLSMGSILLSFLSSSKLKSKLWWGLMLVLSMSFMVTNLFLFYILFELSLVPILLMIIYWGSQPERLSAGLYFLIYTSSFSIPFMVVIVFVYPMISFSFLGGVLSTSWLSMLLMMPFLVKMPIMGLHFWLPKAHVEASTSGSMILAGLLLKLGSYGALRVVHLFNISSIKWTLSYWLFGSIISSIITFMMSDIKKLVAYSSVSHMTFMMVAIISNNKFIYLVVLMLSLAHGWASMGMFASAGMLSNASSSRMGVLLSMESKMSSLMMLLGLLLLSNASLPPFPSFFPELALVGLISFSINMVVFFIFLSVVVCYFNTYVYVWFSHKKSSEGLSLTSSFSENLKLSHLSLLSFLTLAWLQCL